MLDLRKLVTRPAGTTETATEGEVEVIAVDGDSLSILAYIGCGSLLLVCRNQRLDPLLDLLELDSMRHCLLHHVVHISELFLAVGSVESLKVVLVRLHEGSSSSADYFWGLIARSIRALIARTEASGRTQWR